MPVGGQLPGGSPRISAGGGEGAAAPETVTPGVAPTLGLSPKGGGYEEGPRVAVSVQITGTSPGRDSPGYRTEGGGRGVGGGTK